MLPLGAILVRSILDAVLVSVSRRAYFWCVHRAVIGVILLQLCVHPVALTRHVLALGAQ